jgi:hypothetical protein
MEDLPRSLLALIQNLIPALEKESTRSQVLILSAQLDECLGSLLAAHLKPCRAKRDNDDELFRPFAPLRSFSGRISVAYRMGLISRQDAEALDAFRELRNDCAHKVLEFDLVGEKYRDRYSRFLELACGTPMRSMVMCGISCPRTDEEHLIYACILLIHQLHMTEEKIGKVPDIFTKEPHFEWGNPDKQIYTIPNDA